MKYVLYGCMTLNLATGTLNLSIGNYLMALFGYAVAGFCYWSSTLQK